MKGNCKIVTFSKMESDYDKMMAAKSYLPFQMGYLTDWMEKRAREELNETEENRTKALKELRRLIADEKNFDIWTDDLYLLQFLRARKFDAKRAMDVIRNVYMLFKRFPEVYNTDVEYSSLEKLFESNAGGPFTYRHKDGGVVFFYCCSLWDPEQIPIEHALAAMTGAGFFIAEDPATQVCGVHIIFDAKFEFKHLRVVTPRMIKLISSLITGSIPIRYKSIHIVNESAIFGYIFTILKFFLSAKIKERFHFHGSNMDELHKYIPKEILPPKYGGDNINYSASEMSEKVFSSYFEKYLKMLCKGYL